MTHTSGSITINITTGETQKFNVDINKSDEFETAMRTIFRERLIIRR